MRVIFIGLALLSAGCLSPDQPVESASTSDAEAQPANAVAEAAAVPAGELAPPVAKTFPISMQGKTGMWMCAPSGPSSCQGLPAGTDSENTFAELVYEGTPKSVEATLTWMATTPATEEMYFGVFAVRSCGASCWESDGEMYSMFASGTSPLALSATDIVLAPDEMLYIHAGTMDSVPRAPVPVFYSYSLEQEFSLEGTLTAMVNASS